MISTVIKMESSPIQTFVFTDIAMVQDHPKSVTEVNLLAAPRDLFLNPQIPEPSASNKLTLDFTAHGNNLNSYNAINEFINQQQKPVCLVAHNGTKFDFPILKRKLQQLNVSLSDDVLCADSLYAFYDILEHPYEYNEGVQRIFEGSAVRNVFYEGVDVKPSASYKLGDIYKREVTYPPVVPHLPENDNIMCFRISRRLGGRFLSWTDQIQREFADVEPRG